jgi:hypothetical protein
MYIAFSLLFIVTLIVLISVVVAPKSLAKHSKIEINRRNSVLGLIMVALVFYVLASVTAPQQSTKNQTIHLTTAKSSTTESTPTITYKTAYLSQLIPFTSSTIQDPNLAKGVTQVTTTGVNGSETITYKDTYTNGKLTSQTQVGMPVINTQPINQVTSIGTYVAPAAPSCYTASQAANEIGQTGCVQFVGYAYTSSKGEMYLDQYLSAPYGFSVWIPAGYSFGPSVLSKYSGQNINVSGTITSYEGEPEIEVTSASQITLAQ